MEGARCLSSGFDGRCQRVDVGRRWKVPIACREGANITVVVQYIRQEKEVPIIDKLITAIKERLVQGKILPKSKFKEAIGYFMGLIPYLKNYTKHAWARLDNNVAERAIRPIAIGRKNWLFVGNEDSGEAAGVILSLIQTCRAAKINPRVYLEDVMRRLMSHSATKLVELLPDHWASARLL